MANKRSMEYVIDGYVNSRFYKSMKTAQNALGRVKNNMSGLNTMQAQSAAASKKASRGFTMFGGSLARTAISMAATYISLQGLSSAYNSVMTEANEAVRVQTRLNTLMMNVKGTTAAQVKAIGDYSSELMKFTTIEDDVTKAGASQLATYQLQYKNIRKLLPALQDLAVGTYGVNVNQEQMIQSSNLLGKVFTGQVGALRRVGVTFDKTQEKILKTGTQAEKTAMLINVISQNYGGLARKMADTPEGRIVRLRNAWANVKEEIGMKLLPVQEKLVKYLTDHLPQIQAFIDRVISAVSRWAAAMKPVWDAVYGIGKFIADNWSTIEPLVITIAAAYATWKAVTIALTAAQWALNIALDANPIGLIILAISAVVGAVALWIIKWKQISAGMRNIESWKRLFAMFLPGIWLVTTAIQAIATNWNKVTSAVRTAWGWMKKISQLMASISPAGIAIKGVGAIKNKIAGKRADGGAVASNRPYLVGERGPELFSPSKSGFILPNSRLAGAGGINVNLTVNVSGGSSADVETGIRNGTDYLKQQLRRIMLDEKRRTFNG